MRKTLAVMTVLLLTLAALPALAGEMKAESWTGWITDSHCGAKGANAEHSKDCVESCTKGGTGKVVFYNNADQKLYEIDKTADALEHIGHEVVVTGTLADGKIKVEKIAKKA